MPLAGHPSFLLNASSLLQCWVQPCRGGGGSSTRHPASSFVICELLLDTQSSWARYLGLLIHNTRPDFLRSLAESADIGMVLLLRLSLLARVSASEEARKQTSGGGDVRRDKQQTSWDMARLPPAARRFTLKLSSLLPRAEVTSFDIVARVPPLKARLALSISRVCDQTFSEALAFVRCVAHIVHGLSYGC